MSTQTAGGQVDEAEIPALVVENLHTTFRRRGGEVRAVQGVSFSLEHGETLVLLGESGSGKSVTSRSVLGLYGDSARISGRVLLSGIDLTTVSGEELRRLRGARIAMVPQDPTGTLDPLRSIGSQIIEVLRVHGVTRSKLDARVRARELLGLVGIPDPQRVMRSRPHELSGGMRQRVAIAIAVSCDPEVLIADEPTTALDVTVQAQILELFVHLQERLKMSLVLVTHDVGVAEQLGGWVAVMYAGRLVETGRVRDVLAAPQHPYTRGLLESLPSPGIARGELRVISGRPPLTGESFPGCAFAARCPLAEDGCLAAQPPLLPVGSAGGSAACIVTARSQDQHGSLLAARA